RAGARAAGARRQTRGVQVAGAAHPPISQLEQAAPGARAVGRAGLQLTAMIELRGVSKTFEGRARPLLDDISLKVARGETWGLIGPGASGKSVLLKLICGLVAPDAGTITVAEQQRIGMLFQNNALFDFMTVGENVAFPLTRSGDLPQDEIDRRVAERLRHVGLAGSEKKFPNELSGGMRKRAALARAVIARPPILIYDEPTA